MRKFPQIFVLLSYQKSFLGTQEIVLISHGKQAISVWAIEVRLYIVKHSIVDKTMYSDSELCLLNLRNNYDPSTKSLTLTYVEKHMVNIKYKPRCSCPQAAKKRNKAFLNEQGEH